MIATYDGRAVRVLARAALRRRDRWRWVPDLAWLFLADAVVLQSFALGMLKAGRLGLPDYLPVIQCSDALTGLAAAFAILSLFVAGRARWAARNQGRDVVRNQPAAALPPCVAPTFASLALRDWEATRMRPAGLEAFSAMPFGDLRASRMTNAASARSRHALAA